MTALKFTLMTLSVMPGHSRPKDGVASLAYVPGIHALLCDQEGVDGRDIGERSDAVLRTAMPGHDERWLSAGGEIASRSLSSGRPKAGPVGSQ